MPGRPPAHKRVAIQGRLTQADGGGQEIFSFGWADNSALTPEALAKALAAGLKGQFGAPALVFSSSAFADTVKVEAIDATGKVGSSYTASIGGSQGSSDGANITLLSQAVTLETSTPDDHGHHVRGRFYPPAYEAVKGSTTLLTAAQSYAQYWAAFMHAAVVAGSVPVVASTSGGGQLAPVTGVSADTIIDTIRRRKNHVTAQRSSIVSIS